MADGDRRLARIGLGFPTRSCTFSAWKLGRPSGTRMVLPTFPTAEAVGYYRAPLRGWALLRIGPAASSRTKFSRTHWSAG